MKCQACGVETAIDALFCGECGVSLGRGHEGIEIQSTASPAGMIGFSDSIRLGFSRYTDFVNRSSRAEFWWWFLFVNVSALLAGFVDAWLGTTVFLWERGLVGGIFSIGVLIPTLSVGCRRMHDANRSGWWLLLYMVPILGWCILLYWAITPGNNGPNRFGQYPLSRIYKR